VTQTPRSLLGSSSSLGPCLKTTRLKQDNPGFSPGRLLLCSTQHYYLLRYGVLAGGVPSYRLESLEAPESACALVVAAALLLELQVHKSCMPWPPACAGACLSPSSSRVGPHTSDCYVTVTRVTV